MILDLHCRIGKKDALLLITMALLVMVSFFVYPLLEGIVLGMVFFYVGRPVRNIFGKRKHLGALVATICIIAPLSIIFSIGIIEMITQLKWLEYRQGEILAATYGFISWLHIPPTVLDEISRSMQNLAGIGLRLVTGLPFFSLGMSIVLSIVNFLIALCVCYFLLVDGVRLKGAAVAFLGPMRMDFERRCLEKIDSTLCGIYMGSIYTAIAGGLTSVAIFYLFGVPRPWAMASIVFLAGMVPFLTWLIFIPTAFIMYFEYGLMEALFFFLAASILVHVVELVIRPYIVYAKSSLHPLLVLLTFLGGGLMAGMVGFFLAPAMVGVLMGIYQAVREENEKNTITSAESKRLTEPRPVE